MSKTLEQRFWEKVDKTPGYGPNGDCWLWTAAIDSPGYGAVKHMGKKRNSHRVAYELVHGPIARNMEIMHSCDTRLCCNPGHLSAGSKLENIRDAQAKSRVPQGEACGQAKLTDQMVQLIRLANSSGVSAYRIAKETGLCKETIRDVINHTTWKHVKSPDEVAS